MGLRIVELDVEVTFLKTEEGGRRSTPALNGMLYRPNVVIGDPNQRAALMKGNRGLETYLGIQFVSGPTEYDLGQVVFATVNTIFDGPEFEKLVPGVTFTMREGPKIIGWGSVLARREDVPQPRRSRA